jgi:hypothetical protein
MNKTALYGLVFLVGFAGLMISFLRALRRKRRGEPIQDPFQEDVYPGDPRYELFWFYVMKPYYIFFGIIGLLFAVFLSVIVRGLFSL